ncbi:MAG: hypothetical protein JWO38_3840 [Gemmataceae bacterium]|nr:hypothetical protein [Gemmataceae bacterium]
MKSLLRQLHRWRFLERLVRLAWGGSRWLAVVAAVLGVACFADWLYDKRAEVPFVLRLLATAGQAALAAGLAYALVARAWAKAPPLDQLAYLAEKAIPEFGHRLVTALQLNRPGAKTAGMSQMLIAEVTREAGEMAARHRLTKLINYRPVGWAAGVVLPVLLAWGGFVAAKPDLALVLLRRQALLGGEIPRSVRLENITPEVWPSGAEVEIRYRVSGEYTQGMAGTAFVRPDGQPADDYPLAYEKENPDGTATFLSKLPPSSTPFTFRARLGDGRTRTPGRVDFEPPPQVQTIDATLLLPGYLGGRAAQKDGKWVTLPYERPQPRGEVVNALPLSEIQVESTFNKPVVKAVLIPIERGDGNKEVDGKRLDPEELAADGKSAEWTFRTTPKTIGYRIELTDPRGFTSPAPARRGVRMLPDEPPAVEFRKESNRNPDPTAFDGKGDPRIYEWDFPVALIPSAQAGESETGPIQVIYSARSELGVGRVNLAYRVVPRGEPAENVHPRDDPGERFYKRLPLSRTAADTKKVGKWVPDLGLFEKSFVGFGRPDRQKAQVEFYPVPSSNPAAEPGELEGGGRYNFQTNGLRKKSLDGSETKLEVGDTVEIYVEVFDKYSTYLEGKKLPARLAGYTREAKRKTIVTEDDARVLIIQRNETQKKLQDKIRDIATDQGNVFQPQKR